MLVLYVLLAVLYPTKILAMPSFELCVENANFINFAILTCDKSQENYINYRPTTIGKDENGVKRMKLLAQAAESIADGDIVNVQIRRYRQWQLSQASSFASSIIPYINHLCISSLSLWFCCSFCAT